MIRTLFIIVLLGLAGWAATLPGGVIALLFVAALPRNATGKLPAEALRALVDSRAKRQP